MFAEDFFEILNTLWAMTVLVFEKCKKVRFILRNTQNFENVILSFLNDNSELDDINF